LLFAGFAATVAFARTGIRRFWATDRQKAPRLKGVEAASVLTLVFSCVLLTISAEPILRYTTATAASLHTPKEYVTAVLSKTARIGPTRSTSDPESPP